MDSEKKIQEASPEFTAIMSYFRDAELAKKERMDTNKANMDSFHLRQDWGHKSKGQSQEFLPKVTLSTEQITSFLQQGLMDPGGWSSVEPAPGINQEKAKFKPEEVFKILMRQFEKNKLPIVVADSMKVGLLCALMIVKVGGEYVDMPRYEVVEERPPGFAGFLQKKTKRLDKVTKKVWQLKISLIRPEDYFPDPSGRDLYEQEVIEMDWHKLIELAKKYPKEYDLDTIQNLHDSADHEQTGNKAHETNQNPTYSSGRKIVTFIEHWGTICHPQTGEMLHENCVARYTKDGRCITKPMRNPNWHQRRPYSVSPIVRVPFSVWHRGLMDAPAALNHALNEIFNLQFDGGMMSVWGIKQMREGWIDNAAEVSDGIMPGWTAKVNESAPPGAKVIERVDTGTLEEQATVMFQMLDREYQAASLSPDVRNGNLAQRNVKATELVASNQAITGVFKGVVTLIELWLEDIMNLSWLTCAQNMNDLDTEEVKALLGEDRGNLLSLMPSEDRFAATALGYKYKVFGMSTTLNKMADFKKVATLLQTIGTSELLLKEFQRKYSMTRLLGIIVKSLDIDEEKITPDEAELAQRKGEQEMMQKLAMIAAQSGKDGKKAADQGSQIAQVSGMPEDTGMEPGNPGNDLGIAGGMGG
jgi:hypothetical protein